MGFSKIIQSGNVLEVYEYEKDLYRGKKRTRDLEKRDRVLVARREDNVKRLRKKFIRLVSANLDTKETAFLLTLTMVEVVRVRDALRLFTRFIARLRRNFGQTAFRYIAVPEFQTRGSVHFHLIFWGLDYLLQNERDLRSIQSLWLCGTVDCIKTDSSVKLSKYLAKYFTKSLFDSRLLGQKSYFASRNCRKSFDVLPRLFYDDESRDLIWGVDNLALQYQNDFDTMWLGKGRVRIYQINK